MEVLCISTIRIETTPGIFVVYQPGELITDPAHMRIAIHDGAGRDATNEYVRDRYKGSPDPDQRP